MGGDVADMADTADIPVPPGLPFLGNIKALDPEFPLGSMLSLAEQHGERPPVTNALSYCYHHPP